MMRQEKTNKKNYHFPILADMVDEQWFSFFHCPVINISFLFLLLQQAESVSLHVHEGEQA